MENIKVEHGTSFIFFGTSQINVFIVPALVVVECKVPTLNFQGSGIWSKPRLILMHCCEGPGFCVS